MLATDFVFEERTITRQRVELYHQPKTKQKEGKKDIPTCRAIGVSIPASAESVPAIAMCISFLTDCVGSVFGIAAKGWGDIAVVMWFEGGVRRLRLTVGGTDIEGIFGLSSSEGGV